MPFVGQASTYSNGFEDAAGAFSVLVPPAPQIEVFFNVKMDESNHNRHNSAILTALGWEFCSRAVSLLWRTPVGR